MKVALVGFGLIGGSIARALHDRVPSAWEVGAWSPTGAGPRAALEEGVIARAPARLEDVLADAGLIVLAAPPLACLRLIAEFGATLAGSVPPDSLITDVASTKARIMDAAATAGIRFVGGHPMAGREAGGFGAATADLFVDRPWVIVADERGRVTVDPVRVERLERLILDVGARPVRMDAAAHDEAVAAISHLPLVLSAALVEAVTGPLGEPARSDWATARELAAAGWRDMTRLARGEPAMGAGIAATNGPAIAARLRDVRGVLDEWLEVLERGGDPDPVELEKRFQAVRSRLDRPT